MTSATPYVISNCHNCGKRACLYPVQTLPAVRWLQPGDCEPAEGVMLCKDCKEITDERTQP